MQVTRYNPERKAQWDAFVKESRNGTFLFLRDYMDYHADRFVDHSLMYFSDKGKLIAVLPANERDGELFSHQGLTYGGLVMGCKTKAEDVLEAFKATGQYLVEQSFTALHYKQVPMPYCKYPSQEDDYALWLNGAEMTSCKLGTAVLMTDSTTDYLKMVRATKKTDRNRLLRMGYAVDNEADIADFWPVLTENLRHSFDAKPVHTLEEMKLLMSRFPRNIRCSVIRNAQGEVEAGAVLFLTDTVVHTQYLSATEQGKRSNAMDCLLLSLILHYRETGRYTYFEFGTSMDDDNIHLKTGLIAQKEGFGGRGVSYRQFKLTNPSTPC